MSLVSGVRLGGDGGRVRSLDGGGRGTGALAGAVPREAAVTGEKGGKGGGGGWQVGGGRSMLSFGVIVVASFLPGAGHLAGDAVEAVEDVGYGDLEDEGG